jgi:hypothetical protein
LHGSKRSALVYLVVGLFSVMMMIMVTTAAALPLQPLTVRRATVAPRGFPVWVEGYCEYFIVP